MQCCLKSRDATNNIFFFSLLSPSLSLSPLLILSHPSLAHFLTPSPQKWKWQGLRSSRPLLPIFSSSKEGKGWCVLVLHLDVMTGASGTLYGECEMYGRAADKPRSWASVGKQSFSLAAPLLANIPWVDTQHFISCTSIL